MYEDKTLVCKECGKEFVFTAGEQDGQDIVWCYTCNGLGADVGEFWMG